jgi:hypothetical protein
MSDNRWAKAVADLRNELAYIESACQSVGRGIEILRLEAEPLKMEFLKHSLEKRREAVARQRGFTLLTRDKKKIGASLAVTAANSILGGVIARDKYAALGAGLSGFNGMTQVFGETRWAVSLDKRLMMASYNAIPAEGKWVTLESLISAIDKLKMEALQGKRVGTLDNIIQRLQQSKGKLIYIARLIQIQPNGGSRA